MLENKLPPTEKYRQYLYSAMTRFNIAINEARNKYGLFTERQWKELLK